MSSTTTKTLLLWTLMTLLLSLSSVKGFVTKNHQHKASFLIAQKQQVFQLHATPPTMVIY